MLFFFVSGSQAATLSDLEQQGETLKSFLQGDKVKQTLEKETFDLLKLKIQSEGRTDSHLRVFLGDFLVFLCKMKEKESDITPKKITEKESEFLYLIQNSIPYTERNNAPFDCAPRTNNYMEFYQTPILINHIADVIKWNTIKDKIVGVPKNDPEKYYAELYKQNTDSFNDAILAIIEDIAETKRNMQDKKQSTPYDHIQNSIFSIFNITQYLEGQNEINTDQISLQEIKQKTNIFFTKEINNMKRAIQDMKKKTPEYTRIIEEIKKTNFFSTKNQGFTIETHIQSLKDLPSIPNSTSPDIETWMLLKESFMQYYQAFIKICDSKPTALYIDSVKNFIENNTKDIEKQNKQINDEIDRIDDSINQKNIDKKSLKSQLGQLNIDISGIDTEIQSLTTKLKQLDDSVLTLKTEVTAQQKILDAEEDKIKNTQNIRENLEKNQTIPSIKYAETTPDSELPDSPYNQPIKEDRKYEEAFYYILLGNGALIIVHFVKRNPKKSDSKQNKNEVKND